jgi:transposase
LRSDRREQLAGLRQPDGDPLPQVARIRIERLLDRLELTLRQIKEVEVARDAVLKKPAPADEAERMIRSLVDMRALGSYVGLVGTPFSSGGNEREQGIGKDGNRRVRAAMVELAWLWLGRSRTTSAIAGC